MEDIVITKKEAAELAEQAPDGVLREFLSTTYSSIISAARLGHFSISIDYDSLRDLKRLHIAKAYEDHLRANGFIVIERKNVGLFGDSYDIRWDDREAA